MPNVGMIIIGQWELRHAFVNKTKSNKEKKLKLLCLVVPPIPPGTIDNVLDKITQASADPQALQQTLTDSMPFLLNDLKPEARQQLGYQLEEMVHFCQYNERTCDIR